MRILILGKNGQVGWELSRKLEGREGVIALGREECDLADGEALRDAVRRARPEVILNAAAYTAVDKAEEERDLCFQVNTEAPGILAEEAARTEALLVHYSTDYVFDGRKAGAYREQDPIGPLNVYGRSKAAGEEAILAAGCRHVILRTSWVYGGRGKNFLRTMLRLGAGREELRVVADQTGAPTSAHAIAEATLRLTFERGAAASGIYHMTAGGSTTWNGFAGAIFGYGTASPRIVPIRTEEYPTPARRPMNSVLDNGKLESAFGFRMAGWESQLAAVMKGLGRGE